ncbi:hypothetical protein [Porphyromonas pogonae]|uniref:hypothetical protein n=1 Tax=Porphyromonas pogonae TaxID=867595 RepID=UPI002E763EF6|nr:hypothetical protein [Porphyromonas pogonae]
MKKLVTLLVLCIACITMGYSQNGYTQSVYLKNGSIIKGTVVEYVPGEFLKLKTRDGSIMVFKADEIIRINKEATTFKREYNSDKSNGIFDKMIRPGYHGTFEAGYVIGVGKTIWDRYEVATSHGYQINSYIFTGMGITLNYDFDKEIFSIPVYGEVRAQMPYSVVMPFAVFKMGYSSGDVHGLYISPGIGAKLRLGRSFAFNISMAYALQRQDINITFMNNIKTTGSINLGGLSFKAGFEF